MRSISSVCFSPPKGPSHVAPQLVFELVPRKESKEVPSFVCSAARRGGTVWRLSAHHKLELWNFMELYFFTVFVHLSKLFFTSFYLQCLVFGIFSSLMIRSHFATSPKSGDLRWEKSGLHCWRLRHRLRRRLRLGRNRSWRAFAQAMNEKHRWCKNWRVALNNLTCSSANRSERKTLRWKYKL